MASRAIFRDRDRPLVENKGYKAPIIVNKFQYNHSEMIQSKFGT